MQPDPASKYSPFPPVPLPGRQWPNRTLTKAPIWCSVDLRDGNQALAQPMSVDEKIEFFDMLVRIGFKEIEVGFPSASQIEFDFTRRLIEENRIPADVAIQVLCQCREDLITRSLESVRGAKNVIFHLYNSTSPRQREFVFNLPKEEIIKIPVRSVEQLKRESVPLVAAGTRLRLEYSPESFTSTELGFALEICEAVSDVWGPTPGDKIILNLPATVEYATPNVHADQIEWMCGHLTRRDSTIVSLHTHNDRGTGVAATELALLAGADRVEGTLFGNGERTGNLDIVTVALNLYTHGIAPGLDLGDLNAIRDTYERCTRLEVPPRHPYAGELVFTAFSGSHQDAIKKSLAHQNPGRPWDVLYIPIDPSDIGRSYRAIIRINSQSGKGGVAYVLEQEFGFQLPKPMHKEIGKIVNDLADAKGTELTSADIRDAFHREYLNRRAPVSLEHFKTTERDSTVKCEARITLEGRSHTLAGVGNGPIDAFVRALASTELPKFDVISYSEHSLGAGAEAKAVSYIQIKMGRGSSYYGAGIDTNIELASIKAIVSALNRAIRPKMKFEPAKRPLTGETLETLAAALAGTGEKPFRARQVLDWVYKKRARSWDDMTNLPRALRAWLDGEFTLMPAALVLNRHSADVTDKLLLELEDRSLIETVIIRAPQDGVGVDHSRKTICISTQVGCAMGCVFCASGLAGLKRDMSAGEIVAQLLQVCYAEDARTPRARAELASFDNIVVMGMGEPLANYDALIRALTIVNAPWGLGFGARRITVSTSGLVPKIIRLADEPLGFRLAISLHGATDDVRTRIMPVNKAYPLAKLLPAVKAFTESHGRMVTLEFILIEDVNDSPEQARRLRDIALDLHAHVNLIPYNTVDGLPWKRPGVPGQLAFAAVLDRAGVSVTLRREKGHDIAAACGQLRLKTERERGETVPAENSS